MGIDAGVQESIENIFTAVIVGGISKDNPSLKLKQEVFRSCLPRFLSRFTSNIFRDEYAFFYEMLKTLKVKVFSERQLESVLYQNQDLVLGSPYIDLSRWSNIVDGRSSTDDEKVEAFRLNLVEMFEELSNKVVTEEEFDTACEVYISYFNNEYMLETSQNMALIMGEMGYEYKKPRGRRVIYKGVEDAQKYYNDRVKILRELADGDRILTKVVDENWLLTELQKEDRGDDNALIDFGIEEIDSVIGKLRRSNLLGILGPPKGGKTRMANYLVGRCLDAGLNVVVWPLEGNSEEWEAMQTSLMVRKQSGNSLDSKKILERKYENDDVRQLVIAAKTQMATDLNRGKLSFIEGTAYLEDFIDILKQHYDSENPYDVVVIDSLVNMESRGRISKTEKISEAYMSFKRFLVSGLKVQPLGIVPAQLKQVAVDMLRKNPDDTIDVTAGGESAETIRTPDEIIGLFSSKEERNAGIMKIYSVGTRHSQTFDDFAARCELGCCYFYSDPELNR